MSESDSVPMPIVLIDQDSDPESTIVQVSFGDRLGALLDTVKLLLFLFERVGLLDMVKLLLFPVEVTLSSNISFYATDESTKRLGLACCEGNCYYRELGQTNEIFYHKVVRNAFVMIMFSVCGSNTIFFDTSCHLV